mgnify:CR=1 FL=1
MKLPKVTAVTYTILKAMQLFSLFALGLSTIVTWIVEIYFALELSLESDRKYGGFSDPESVNEYIKALANIAPSAVVLCLIVGVVLTSLLLILKRAREHNKSYIVSCYVFIFFCFIATAFAHAIIKQQLTNIIGI